MKYFDPARPHRGDQPYYVSREGKAVAAMPRLQISPKPGEGWEAAIMVLTPEGAGTWRSKALATNFALAELLRYWKDDPELTMLTYFQYEGKPSVKPTSSISLEDLGL